MSNTTTALFHSFSSWGSGVELPGHIDYRMESEHLVRPIIGEALQRREGQAMTFSYFQAFLERAGLSLKSTEASVRTYIYLTYTRHYQRSGYADIPTGFPCLSIYEKYLSENFPFHDLPTIERILESCGISSVFSIRGREEREAWQSLGHYRGRELHSRITTLIRIIICAVRATIHDDTNTDFYAMRYQLQLKLGPYLFTPNDSTPARSIVVLLERAEVRLNRMIQNMKNQREMAAVIDSSESFIRPSCDVLLVTATIVETTELLKALQLYGPGKFRRVFVGEITFLDVGFVGATRVFIVQSGMGSGGPSGSTLTIYESITSLRPASVILLGIGFGMAPTRQDLGEILVSTQMFPYEISRLGTDQYRQLSPVPRGDKPSASPRLLSRCKSAVLDWRGARVSFGLLASGEKLVDNLAFRDDLQQFCGGEALGGEMEGAGLYASAHRLKVDWIVIKAISDWADGNKQALGSRHQQTAARNAARFVQHVLQQGHLALP
jgi:nucleoside phosphorylase